MALTPVPFPLSRQTSDDIREAAERREPREACGVVALGRSHELTNVAPGDHTFEVSAEELAEVVLRVGGWENVSAVWHSHPPPASSPRPSRADEEGHPLAKVMIIVADDELYAYAHEA